MGERNERRKWENEMGEDVLVRVVNVQVVPQRSYWKCVEVVLLYFAINRTKINEFKKLSI